MTFRDTLPVESNVLIRAYSGKVLVYEHAAHNVFTNMGRNWLAESLRATAGSTRKVDTLPYYLAVGQGSDQQTVSPPGVGVQAESAGVTYIENPVQITSGVYLKAFTVPTTEPSDYTNRYEVSLGTADVSFGAQPSVPLTEFAIITANAVPTTPGGKKTVGGGPYAGTYNNGYLIAYKAIPPVTKTALITSLQILWELRA